MAAVVVLRVAPSAATIFLEHPHIEGGITVELEVQGALPAQAARGGKCLPATGQGQAAGCRDLQRSLGGSATGTVRLKPEAAQGASRKLT